MNILLAFIIAVAPLSLHYTFLLGRKILSKIKSPIAILNQIYNRAPLVITIFCGLTLSIAFLIRNTAIVTADALVIAAVLLGAIDLYASTLSLIGYLEPGKKRGSNPGGQPRP